MTADIAEMVKRHRKLTLELRHEPLELWDCCAICVHDDGGRVGWPCETYTALRLAAELADALRVYLDSWEDLEGGNSAVQRASDVLLDLLARSDVRALEGVDRG